MSYKFRVKRVRREWHWQLIASNGELIADSGDDGYKNLADCLHGIERVKEKSPDAPISFWHRKTKKWLKIPS